MIHIPDSKLVTYAEKMERVRSINKQIEKLEGVRNPRDFEKHHKKYCSLVQRRETLCYACQAMEKATK